MSNLLGRPIIILPYRCPGCLDRLRVFLRRWAGRLALFGLGFVAGCTYRMVVIR